ncbi:MAG: hypothetical protein RSG23_10775 [Gordonibacter sp.]|uniref:hypothetical protein n=1 Tax=Gordonibacter sp. TaxID=1968902 RepID=UPI002FC745F6
MPALNPAVQESFLELLHNTDLILFAQEEMCTYRYHDEFCALPMPDGADPEFMWEFVSFLRRMTGKPSVRDLVADGTTTLSEHSIWTTTPDMFTGLNDIVSRANLGSRLWRSLEHLQERPGTLQLAVEELEAAAFRDGIAIERETLRELVHENRRPSTDEERLFSNALDLARNLGALAVEQPSVELFLDLYRKLEYGVGALSLTPYRQFIEAIPEYRRTEYEALEEVVKGSTASCFWGPHPLIDTIMNADVIWATPPFERFSGIMEVLIRWRSYHAIGVPALCFVPLSKMRLDWERRLIGAPIAPMRFGEALVTNSFGMDSTPYIQQIIRFLDEGLDRLERIVERIDEADTCCKHLISQDCRLTLRQKQLLETMVDDPSLVIDVSSYQSRFDVAASTARNDLTRLVSLNLLFSEFRNKRQLFWARSNMTSNLKNGTR